MKFLATVIALNLAVIGTGVYMANSPVQHDIVTVDQVLEARSNGSSMFQLIEDSVDLSKYNDQLKELTTKFTDHELEVRAFTEAQEAKKAEQAALEAKIEFNKWKTQGEYTCSEWTATRNADGSSTNWDKSYSKFTLIWNYHQPETMEMRGNYDSFLVTGMQGYETSYGKDGVKEKNGRVVDYEIELDEINDQVIKVKKLVGRPDGSTYNIRYVCR